MASTSKEPHDMSSDFGSYTFGTFTSNGAELERLERQAAVAWELERVHLLGAGLAPGMRVLDLACGPGFISRRIAEIVGPEGSVCGIDLNGDLLETAAIVARHWADRPEPRAELSFTQMNVYELDLSQRAFDFVYARFLFQHLDRPDQALSRIRKVMRPRGTICIADVDDGVFSMMPESTDLNDFMTLAAHSQGRLGGDRTVGRKLAYYLKRAGFENVQPHVVMISSDQISIDAFLAITTRFKLELIEADRRADAEAMLDRIAARAGADDTHALVGVYVVTGHA